MAGDPLELVEGLARGYREYRRRRVGAPLEPPSLLEDDDRREKFGGLVRSLVPPEWRRSPKLLAWRVAAEEPGRSFWGVDGSSRRLDAIDAVMGAFSVGAARYMPGFESYGYPNDGVSLPLDLRGAPFLAIGPPEIAIEGGLLGKPVRLRPLVDPEYILTGGEALRRLCRGDASCAERVKRLARLMEYGLMYDYHTMIDENRVYLENVALTRLAASGEASVIIVDGPLFSTPGLFARLGERGSGEEAARLYYTLIYYLLVESRARIVASAARRGRLVAGIVKRLGRSRALAAALGGEGSDEKLVSWLVMQAIDGSRGAVVVGPVVVVVDIMEVYRRLLGKLALDDLERLASIYVDDPMGMLSPDPVSCIAGEGGCEPTIPPRPETMIAAKRVYYVAPPGGRLVFRVELPCMPINECVTPGDEPGLDSSKASALRAADEELLAELTWLASMDGLGLPVIITAADRAAKLVTQLYASLLVEKLSEAGARFTYETLVEAGLAVA